MLTHNDPEDVVRWVKERVIASYKNGLAGVGRKERDAGGKPARSSGSSNRGGNIAQHHGH